MGHIKLIMFPEETFHSTGQWFPLFVHEGSLKRSNWDEIQQAIDNGSTVTIRPPTPEELKAAEPDIARCTALAR